MTCGVKKWLLGLPVSTFHPLGISTETIGGTVRRASNSILECRFNASSGSRKGSLGSPLNEKPEEVQKVSGYHTIHLTKTKLTKDGVEYNICGFQLVNKFIDWHKVNLEIDQLLF
jgi:hypothetical protein